MNNINTILKLNALNCLLFGALFVFIPQHVITFLSDISPAPEVAVVAMGVVLNLYGMLLLWLGNKQKPNSKLILLVAIGDAAWVLLTAGLVVSQTWITHINGITAAGLVAILVGWFGWQQWQYYLTET
ncbi:hypothetical protein MNBD_GAMMA02-781 [hydrothermal vent metagenome]|uniref:Uncharacterized protein n=1 Tax=hydrothermal vent metagenome TaxID=652676 RepID=A0A3B0VQE0_9ZZZZ